MHNVMEYKVFIIQEKMASSLYIFVKTEMFSIIGSDEQNATFSDYC